MRALLCPADGRSERAFELARSRGLHDLEPKTQRASSGLGGADQRWVQGRIPENSDALESGDHFLEQLQPFAGQLWEIDEDPREVAAWSGKADDEAAGHGIRLEIESNDRDRLRRIRGRPDRRRTDRDDHVDLETDRLGRILVEPILVTAGESVLDEYVLARNVAELPEGLPEYPLLLLGSPGVQLDNAKGFRRLRLGRDRRGEGPSQRGQEEAAAVHAGMVRRGPT